MSAPKRLGRYELIEQLGQGGMGEVWLARLTGAAGFEKPCLLKSVLPRLATDKQFVERFQHEGQVLVHLQHANIAQVLDMGDADGALYIALEYVMGVDVAGLHETVFRDGGQLPVPLALWICQQAAEGLSYAHTKSAPDGTPLQIIHRDVSPHNLMVSYDGEVKVIDFGIARSAAKRQETQPQTVLGKIGYMAPEQARGDTLDARVDQYALGIVLWELLTDQPFVRPGTVGEMMGSMANPAPRPLREYRPDVPQEIEQVVQRALMVSPAMRFARMADFSSALLQELARRYKMPNREDLSSYVREKCAPQWQAHQALLKRVSSGQRAVAAAPAPAAASAPAQAVAPKRPPTVPPAETKASLPPAMVAKTEVSAKPQPSAETKLSRPTKQTATPVSEPQPAPLAAPKPNQPNAPAVTPIMPPQKTLIWPPNKQAAEPAPAEKPDFNLPRESLVTDKSLEKVGASRAPLFLVVFALATGLGLGAYWFILRAPESVETPHGPVPAQALDVPDASVAEAPKPAPRPMPLALKGSVKFLATANAYEVTNAGPVRWTDCFAIVPGQRRGALPDLAPKSGYELADAKLRADFALPELTGKVTVHCKEGSGTFPLGQ